MEHSIGQVAGTSQVLESENIELLAEKATIGSEMNVKNMAEDNLGLVKAVKGQVGLYNRNLKRFEYR